MKKGRARAELPHNHRVSLQVWSNSATYIVADCIPAIECVVYCVRLYYLLAWVFTSSRRASSYWVASPAVVGMVRMQALGSNHCPVDFCISRHLLILAAIQRYDVV